MSEQNTNVFKTLGRIAENVTEVFEAGRASAKDSEIAAAEHASEARFAAESAAYSAASVDQRLGELSAATSNAQNAANTAQTSAERADSAAISAENASDEAERTVKMLEDKLANGEFTGEKGDKGDKGDRGERGYSALMPKKKITSPSGSISVAANSYTAISVPTGDITIGLGSGVVGYDNEWAFEIAMGENAVNVTLPNVNWLLGIAPIFAPGFTTEIRLHVKGNTLWGVWS